MSFACLVPHTAQQQQQRLPKDVIKRAVLASDTGGDDDDISARVITQCWDFTRSSWRHHDDFVSPNYPRNYANNTDCVQILQGK